MRKEILHAIKSFWQTRKKQGSVLAGKQLDAFLLLLKKKQKKQVFQANVYTLRTTMCQVISAQQRIGTF